MKSVQEQIQEALATSVPLHYPIVHRFDPRDSTHQEALDAIAGRGVLHEIERQAPRVFHRPTGKADHDPWVQGVSYGMLFWARAAQRRPSWGVSVFLEIRDLLWEEGHPFDPHAGWEGSFEPALRLLGYGPRPYRLHAGEEVTLLKGNLHNLDGMAAQTQGPPLEAATLTLRALSMRQGSFVVQEEAGPGAQAEIRIRNTRGNQELHVPRHLLWPKGCPKLRDARQKALQAIQDALEASLNWSNQSDVDVVDFYDYYRARILLNPALWSCEHGHGIPASDSKPGEELSQSV